MIILKVFLSFLLAFSSSHGFVARSGLRGSSGASCEKIVSITSSWAGNFGGSFGIPLEKDISSFTITVTSNLPLTLVVWNGHVSPKHGTSFTITSKTWFEGAKGGSILKLGFQASFSGKEQPEFTSVFFNGKDLCYSGPLPTNLPIPTTASPLTTASDSSTSSEATTEIVPTTSSKPSDDCSTETNVCSLETLEPITEEVKKLRILNCMAENIIVDKITDGGADNPANVKILQSVFSSSDFAKFFPNANPAYTYENFLKAIGKFPSVCTCVNTCKKTLATMFAHFHQETADLLYLEEINKSDYCANWNAWINKAYPCVPGKQYYGRGAKQLSWNYNYGRFSEEMFGDASILLNNPGKIANTWLNFASAIWFYVTPQPPKPSMMAVVDGTWKPNSADVSRNILPGFGATTMIINGALECGAAPSNPTASSNRQASYKNYAAIFNLDISGEKLDCVDMQQFDRTGSASVAMYWAPESGCKLVTWQTAYSALIEGNHARCLAD